MTEELKEARNNRVITESMEDTEWLEMPKAGLRWKRLVIMLGVAENHATTGAIITHFEQMRKRIAEEKYEEYKRAAGSSADKVFTTKLKKLNRQSQTEPCRWQKGSPCRGRQLGHLPWTQRCALMRRRTSRSRGVAVEERSGSPV